MVGDKEGWAEQTYQHATHARAAMPRGRVGAACSISV